MKNSSLKIKPGLWALKEEKEKVLKLFDLEKNRKSSDTEFNHSYYQGLLLEIGKIRNFQIYIPNQDKNKKYLEKPLKHLATIDKFYDFIMKYSKQGRMIDLSWFNERKFPYAFFEKEYSTDLKNFLLKF